MKSNCFVWIFLILPIVISQNVCDITWKELNNTNFRNAFRANIQPSIQGCLDECQAFSACLAVDVDLRNSGDDYYICWYHSNPKDIETNYFYDGLNAYIKTVNCSKNASYEGSVGDTGYPGSPGPIGNTGPPGNPGVPGIAGFIGPTGSMGWTGATGQPGQRGNAGPTGPGGATGSKGRIGDTGATGSIGAPGPPGDTAFSSANSSSSYIRAACPTTWNVYNNSQSNGSIPFPFMVNSVDQCKDVCLSYPNCVAMEFSTINSSCRIHNISNNLSDKIKPSTFDQYILDRCYSLVGKVILITLRQNGSEGQPGELGLSGSSGMTGQAGIMGSTGSPGIIGQTGSTGFTGFPGNRGMAGVTGLYGPYGNTGSIGDTGSTGPLGLAGAIRIVASNGSSYNIKDSCQPQWVTLEGFRSKVGGSTLENYDPDTCKVICLNDTNCVAFDYNVKKSICQWISNVIDLIDKVADDDITQYVLLSKCSTAFNFTSPIQGSTVSPIPLKRKEKNSKNHGNGYDNDDDEYGDDGDDDDCVSLDIEEGALSDPELCALFVAPPLTIMVNILCWWLHSGGRKIANCWRMDGWSVEKLNDDDDDDDEKIIEI